MKSPFLTLISFAIFLFPAPAEEKKSDMAAKQARKIEFSAQGTPPGTMKFAKPELKIKAVNS